MAAAFNLTRCADALNRQCRKGCRYTTWQLCACRRRCLVLGLEACTRVQAHPGRGLCRPLRCCPLTDEVGKEDFDRTLNHKRSKITVTFVELDDTTPVHGPETEVIGQLACGDFPTLLNPRDREVVVVLRAESPRSPTSARSSAAAAATAPYQSGSHAFAARRHAFSMSTEVSAVGAYLLTS